MTTLKAALKDWHDWEGAGARLADCLGLSANEREHEKAMWWVSNPLGNMLGETLDKLVALGVLEQNEQGEYRWNQSFPGTLREYVESW